MWEEREIKTMHKTCQWGTVKSKAESNEKLKAHLQWERDIQLESLETPLKANSAVLGLPGAIRPEPKIWIRSEDTKYSQHKH